MSPVIDAHLHLWQLGGTDYAWVTPELGPLHRSFGPDDIESELVVEQIDGVVLVQADDTPDDTRYMLSVAAEKNWVAGVIGWVPLDQPMIARQQLDELQENRVFRGVRHLVHTDPRPDFMDLPTVRESLRDVSGRGLTLDVPDAWPRHFSQALGIANALPDLTIVLDHLGKPPIGTGEFSAWQKAIAEIARYPNVFAKVSGLRKVGTPYTANRIAPAFDTALAHFGAERLMWGSDWPMAIADGGYGAARAVLAELIGALSPSEAASLRGGTASAVYCLADAP